MLLGRTIALPSGPLVRLRLPHTADRPGLRALLERLGAPHDDRTLTALLRFDPRRRAVVVATTWAAGRGASVVGVACGARAEGEPDMVVVDPELGPGLRAALDQALAERAALGARPA